jgi:hypothetical protein
MRLGPLKLVHERQSYPHQKLAGVRMHFFFVFWNHKYVKHSIFTSLVVRITSDDSEEGASNVTAPIPNSYGEYHITVNLGT